MIKQLSTRALRNLWLTAIFTLTLATTLHAQTIETVIPADSLVYLKLQNLKECREVIERSHSWKEAMDIVSAASEWQDISQFMQMLPMFVGTDVVGLIDTFLGGQVAVTVSPGAEGLRIGVVIENEGKMLAAEQTVSTLMGTLSSMAGNQVQLQEGTYQGVPYHTVQLNVIQLTYGYVNETLLLIGITPGSFEKMVDTYQRKGHTITENALYRAVANTFGKSEVFAFVNVETGAPYLKAILPAVVGAQLDAFRTLVCSWELLKPGGSLHLHGILKKDAQGTLIPLFREPSEMQALQGLSGEEELFLSVGSASARTLWQMLVGPGRGTTGTDGSLRSFLIPDQTDVLGAVAGELVISANPSTFDDINLKTHSPEGRIEGFEVEFREMDLGLIFSPDSDVKWQAFFKGLLEKLSTQPPRQFNYKGRIFYTAAIPGPLSYGTVNELFVLALSEKKYQSLVDNLLSGKPVPTFKRRLERLPAHPACLFQLNLDTFLSSLHTGEEITWSAPEMFAFTDPIGVLLASLAVGETEAAVELTLSPEEKPLDAIARAAPAIFLAVMQN